MIKRNAWMFTLLAVILLSACNYPRQQSNAPDPNQVATRVQELLLTQTTATAIRVNSPTLQPAAPTIQMDQTATPTQIPSPTKAAVPTPTEITSDPKLSLGDPTYKDTFDAKSKFRLYDDGHVKFALKSGSLLLEAYKPDKWQGWTLSYGDLTSFYMETTLKTGTCAGVDQYGLMIRAKGDNAGYFYGFSCDGQYNFAKWDGNSTSDLVNWTVNDAIQKGSNQTNRMGIMAKGQHFSFYANGTLIGEFDDNSSTHGTFGLFIASTKTPNFTVLADEIEYWKLPD
jgi:hypothetical protein